MYKYTQRNCFIKFKKLGKMYALILQLARKQNLFIIWDLYFTKQISCYLGQCATKFTAVYQLFILIQIFSVTISASL